tara:strand:+ start:14204 stop:15850 length:1647 start_codon:yes stop_codon:yes gene_type:complete
MSAKGLTPVVLSGLGSAGLNTQSQDATLGPEWLTEADNVVFDFQGRIAARKGIKQVSKIVASSIKTIGGYIKPDRTREYFGGSGATVVKMDTTVIPHSLTTQSFSGTPQTITDSDWQWVNFNDEFWGVQDGHTPINYDGTNWYDIDDLGAYAAPTGPTTFDPSCALGDFGRMWYGGITEDPGTIYYSDNLIGEKLTGGAAGILNLRTVWGSDEIVGISSLEDKIVFFGKQNIVIYSGAGNPATMVLSELIRGTGLAGRDNVGTLSADLVFLSYEGLMSLKRLTQTDGKAPIDDLSIAVRNDLARILSTSTVSNIKSAYYMEDGIIVTFMPDDQKAYVFDFATSQKIPRITVWAFTSTAASPLCGLGTIDGKMYMGMTDSIAEYAGYYDVTISESTGTYGNQTVCEAAGDTWETSTCWSYTNSDYSYTFQSSWLDLGNPVVSKIVKTGLFTFVGGRGATAEVFVFKDYELGSQFSHSFTLTNSGTVYLYGQPDALFGTAIYASTTGPQEYRIPLGRTGKVIRLKLVTTVSGNSSSLVNTTLLTKQGKIR